MSTGGPAVPEHPVPTRNHGYRYQFHPKHHDPSRRDVAQWLPEMSREAEFAVFDLADVHDLLDVKGNLYGLRLGPDREVFELGTLGQQVAMFPQARDNQHWHGYPLMPLWKVRPPHPEVRKAPSAVLQQMVDRGLLEHEDRNRLEKGKG